MGKKMCYVVLRERCPGIYHTWPQCSAQVTGYSVALFHGCDSLEVAERDLTCFLRHHEEVRRSTDHMEQIGAPTHADEDSSSSSIKKLVTIVLVLLIAVMLKYLAM